MKVKTPPQPRRKSGTTPRVDEHKYVPRTIHEARQLYVALIEAGTSQPVARGIVATLQTLPATYPRAFRPTITHYRHELAKLAGPPWDLGPAPRGLSRAFRDRDHWADRSDSLAV